MVLIGLMNYLIFGSPPPIYLVIKVASPLSYPMETSWTLGLSALGGSDLGIEVKAV